MWLNDFFLIFCLSLIWLYVICVVFDNVVDSGVLFIGINLLLFIILDGDFKFRCECFFCVVCWSFLSMVLSCERG